MAKSKSLPVCSRLPWVRSIWLPPQTPKSLTARFSPEPRCPDAVARNDRKMLCCPRYPGVLVFARLLATRPSALLRAIRDAHAAENPLSIGVRHTYEAR